MSVEKPGIKGWFINVWNAAMGRSSLPSITENKPAIDVPIPTGRVSRPADQTDYSNVITNITDRVKLINPKFNRSVIPLIRKLVMINPDVGQALNNVVTLGNTNHEIYFDRNVSDEYALKMKNHLANKHAQWAPGAAGAHGLSNRFFSQLMIGGALATEWVPKPDFSGIESVILINPEDIVCALNTRKTGYDFYQQAGHTGDNGSYTADSLIKLNPATFKYFALNGDGEVPYGFPPYMAALDRINTQDKMNINIDHVTDLLGILGFLEVLVAAEPQRSAESDESYRSRVISLMTTTKESLLGGLKDGILVGIEGMHTLDFKAVGKEFDKVIELYKNNELQIGSGLKQDPTLWGRDYNTSESQITVMFMKMLSEFRHMQNITKVNLEFGYSFELRLAGFKFDYLTVKYDRSTIQDDLKYHQAEEIKIRNVKDKYIMGTISEVQVANELGYEAPDQNTPRVPIEILAGVSPNTGEQAQKDEKRKKQKGDSAKKTRDTNKPQGSKK